MGIVVTFLLGVGNFAWHRAVVESGHRMMSEIAPEKLRIFRLLSLSFEFLILCGALFAAHRDQLHWIWAYAAYSLFNGGAAWSILKGRV